MNKTRVLFILFILLGNGRNLSAGFSGAQIFPVFQKSHFSAEIQCFPKTVSKMGVSWIFSSNFGHVEFFF